MVVWQAGQRLIPVGAGGVFGQESSLAKGD
ncbi:hypothetical protein PCAR4_350186 [Paraburkholderia caribensis]|jgi:hypothetical protein|nr:hypothetical protein PCAR4_350186 [Paraburkholderia caribensis]